MGHISKPCVQNVLLVTPEGFNIVFYIPLLFAIRSQPAADLLQNISWPLDLCAPPYKTC